MAVGYQTSAEVARNFADNLCRWDGQSSDHFEVWFLTLNQRARRRGFWFRYTLELSRSEPHAALWAGYFDRAHPERNLFLKQSYPLDDFVIEGRDQTFFKLGSSLLAPARAKGAVRSKEHSITWDLSFTPNSKTYHHINPSLKLIARPSSSVCAPNLDTRFTGTVVVDGEEILLDQEPGCQSHLWGHKRVDEWVWVHSNAFEGHEGTVFEGITARARRAGYLLPPLQSLFLRHNGEEHHFTRLRFADQWKQRLGVGYWTFSAMNTQVYIEGSAQCHLRDMVQVEYIDPDGQPLYSINSEVANMKIRIFRRVHNIRFRHVETIKANTTTHLEYASRALLNDVKTAFD